MQNQIRLSLNAKAWFFVGKSDDVGSHKNVPIAPPFRIGRNPEFDLCLPCSSVSGLHAEIVEEEGEIWLRDLNSTNGTFVNGKRIALTRLNENDTVQFGTTVFQISGDQEQVAGRTEKSTKEIAELQNEQFERLFNGGVVPFFQPIYGIERKKQQVIGYEVLGRSRLFGLRTPAQMFAAASRMEMEAELSRVLRNQGLKVADSHLPEQYSLFVNTHPAELRCRGFEDSLFEIRDNHPERPIVLEVHESVLNETETLNRLNSTLQSLEIQLAFHDFGGGKICLAELGEVLPEVIKFDVKLIQGIDTAPAKRQNFVAAMVKMVTELGITPQAECVEQAAEHEAIRQLGFQLGQGFYYGRPSSISDCLDSPSRQSVRSEIYVPEVKSFLKEPSELPTADHATLDANKDAQWLLSQPKNHYTIQVLSAISMDRAFEHIAMQENPEEFAVFCKQGKTRMLYIVVYGIFEDRSAAKEASAQLANSSISPWIRLLSSVHAEIESNTDA